MTRGIALVTGAGQGLGLALSRQLAAADYTVVLTARSFDKAGKAELQVKGEVVPMSLDLERESDMLRVRDELKERFGKLDVLVNNAGINLKDQPDKERFNKVFRIADFDVDEMQGMMRANALLPTLLVRHLLPLLRAAEPGRVINISSWLGSIGEKAGPGHYGYAGSKSLLNMMTKAAALELAGQGVYVASVNPGWMRTKMGGDSATLSPDESAAGIVANVIDKLDAERTGRFYNWDGSEHPW
jgi:NAD(P)-dependent dehydrogenase (short-subunit alcohol dehydrogenase family)